MRRRLVQPVTSSAAAARAYAEEHAGDIGRTWATYERLFETLSGGSLELDPLGELALERTAAYAPGLAAEMEAMAAGSGLPVERIAALNARTEILACSRRRSPGECSAVVVLGEGDDPLAVQTWDWHEELSQAWLIREIPGEGRVVRTFTEHGIVGKIGVSSGGLGVLFTILRHARDGAGIGVPVHVVSRRILDEASTVGEAFAIASEARVSASTSVTVVTAGPGRRAEAASLELYPGGPALVEPDESGVLVHTNHFLAPEPASEDEEPALGPDSLIRRRQLRAAFASLGRPELDEALGGMSHHGEDGPVCRHVEDGTPFGERYQTLATVVLDVARGRVTAFPGGPCTARGEGAATAAAR